MSLPNTEQLVLLHHLHYLRIHLLFLLGDLCLLTYCRRIEHL